MQFISEGGNSIKGIILSRLAGWRAGLAAQKLMIDVTSTTNTRVYTSSMATSSKDDELIVDEFLIDWARRHRQRFGEYAFTYVPMNLHV